MQLGALPFLALAVAAVGAEAAAATGKAAAGGAGELGLCGREEAACAEDAECGGHSATAMDSGGGETEQLPRCGVGGGRRRWGGGVGGGNGDRAGSGGDLFFEGPPATRCERVGATACRGFTEAAAGAAAPAASQEKEEEQGGELSASRRIGSCLGNGLVQALLACRVRTAGCEPDDAPCITPDKRSGGVASPAGESNARKNARPAPRPLSEDEQHAGSAAALPAGGDGGAVNVKADAKGFDPAWASMYQRRLVTTSSEATCDGIQNRSACCGATCGECGGLGCSDRGNGAEDCCTVHILNSGVLCSDTGGAAPCIVDGDPEPPSPGPDFTPSPETSETPSPETAETPSPGAPETPSPETSETPSPGAPETPSPETPETPSPVTPGTPSPETPETPSPTTPETPSPVTPETPSPEKPETPSPETPETPSPVTPETPSPETPDTPSPVTPETPSPATPATPSPVPPETPSPATLETPSPVTPETPSPETPETPSPQTPETPSPVTPETPETVAPTLRETNAPSSGPTAMPTSAPTSPAAPSSAAPSAVAPSASPTGSPTASPTRSAEVTLTRAPAGTPADEELGFLGPGFMSGSFSADGVSDELLASLGGEDGVVRQVVCELDPCPGGAESVLVGNEAATQQPSVRMLLLGDTDTLSRRGPDEHQTERHEERLQHRAVVRSGDGGLLRGEDRTRRQSGDEAGGSVDRKQWRRRRLADVEDVAFLVPLGYGAIDWEDGEVMTASQQAAAFVNNVADPVVLGGMAADLGVDVEDLDFAGLAFYQGSEFRIEKDFGALGSVKLSSVRGIGEDDNDPGRLGTWILALCLAALATCVVAVSFRYYLERGGPNKKRRCIRLAWPDKPIPNRFGANNNNPIAPVTTSPEKNKPATASVLWSLKKMATFDDKSGGDVDVSEDEVDYDYDAVSLARSGGAPVFPRRFRSSEISRSFGRQRNIPAIVPRTGSTDSSDIQLQPSDGGAEVVGNTTSDSDDDVITHGQFHYRHPAFWAREPGNRSSMGLAEHYADDSGDSSREASSTSSAPGNRWVNPLFDQNESGPRQSYSESESDGEPERTTTRPVARMVKRVPLKYSSRSFSEPDLSAVSEKNSVGRGESDLTSSSASATSESGESDVTTSSFLSTGDSDAGGQYRTNVRGDGVLATFPEQPLQLDNGRGASLSSSSSSSCENKEGRGHSSRGTVEGGNQERGKPTELPPRTRLLTFSSTASSSFSDVKEGRHHSSRCTVESGDQEREQQAEALKRHLLSFPSSASGNPLEGTHRHRDSASTLPVSLYQDSPKPQDHQYEKRQDGSSFPTSPPRLGALHKHGDTKTDAAKDSVAGGDAVGGSGGGDTGSPAVARNRFATWTSRVAGKLTVG